MNATALPARESPASARADATAGLALRAWLSSVSWIALYLGLVALPIVALVLTPDRKGSGFWWDFAMGLGFGGLAIFVLQAVLTARFRRATAPFGIDILYYFHRLTAIGGLVLVVSHYGILRAKYGEALGAIAPWSAPWPMTAGRLSLLLFIAIAVTSMARKSFNLEYDRWRIWHAIMAAAAIALAFAHVAGIGQLSAAPGARAIWIGYFALWIAAVAYVRLLRPSTLSCRPYRITAVRKERAKSWSLTLEPVWHAGLRFKPGQFAWLTLRSTPFRGHEHPFSFSGSALDAPKLTFTIKELGDFTRTIGETRAGEIAYVDGPHGIFSVDRYPKAERFVFVAGGVGIAPIMSMLRTLADRGDRRPLRLVYGNWGWEDILFREEIEALRPRLALEVVYVLQAVPPDWPGLQGVLNEPILRRAIPEDERGGVFFVCGPAPMIASVQETMKRLRVPLHRIHFEHFDMA